MGPLIPAPDVDACEALRFCKGPKYDMANERSRSIDVIKPIDRNLKLNPRGATPNTVEQQAKLLEYCPYWE